MAVLSVLRPSLQRNIGAAALTSIRKNPKYFLSLKNTQKVISRNVGVYDVPRKMMIMPTKYMNNKFFDEIHFFFFLGVIPLLTLIFCSNVFIGPAELRDIPEGYEPEEHEYVKFPIQRFLAKHFYPSYQKCYERDMAVVYQEMEYRNFRKLERKVGDLQSERQDYRGWYFVPGNLDSIRLSRKSRDDYVTRED